MTCSVNLLYAPNRVLSHLFLRERNDPIGRCSRNRGLRASSQRSGTNLSRRSDGRFLKHRSVRLSFPYDGFSGYVLFFLAFSPASRHFRTLDANSLAVFSAVRRYAVDIDLRSAGMKPVESNHIGAVPSPSGV